MTARDDSLDAGRGLLMVLGVFLHAANIYTPDSGWVVTDPDSHAGFGWLVNAIHAFRMPAFFWISGYFSAMVLGRPDAARQLRTRLIRIALPLLVVWLGINTLQMAATAGAGIGQQWRFPPPLYHLWFLLDLLVFTLILRLLDATPLLAMRPATAAPARRTTLWVLLLFVAAAWVLSAAVRSSRFAYTDIAGLTSPFRLATYLPYFLLGAWMFRRKAALAAFNRIGGWAFPVGLVIAMAAQPLTLEGATLQRELALMVQIGATALCVAGLLALLRRLFGSAHGLTRLMSDSAYTIYLLHHVIVVVLGLALLGSPLPPVAKYLLIVVVATGLPLLAHLLLVRRTDLLSWALNGRPAPR
ncbi:acyltransferase family protein [Pseudorhodoferax sp.]|uniref:acyltransferase family protein n=1 Tax=Pseudorhodoferax sp. TaxID=1993553 RepID=UPI002DD69ECE|nr:acyltransferase family protein [Pseudorhodoferax sp.]